jgi:protein TonB
MKLDIFNKGWLDIVFEGRNKSYGAYELRKSNGRTSIIALIIGAVVFAFAVATPMIADFIGNSSSDDEVLLNKKIVTIKLPPKEKPVENLPPPPPPPPKVDVVKFVKPVVAKKEEITEEPPPQKALEKKDIGDKNIKGDPDAPATLAPVGDGPKDQEVTEDPNKLYSMAGIETKPDFPGGMAKFYKYIGEEFEPSTDEDFKGGKVFVSFVVEKDGSLTDIKVTRDVGYGSKEEAIRVLKKCRKWVPGEQNGKKVRVLYSLPITIQANAE